MGEPPKFADWVPRGIYESATLNSYTGTRVIQEQLRGGNFSTPHPAVRGLMSLNWTGKLDCVLCVQDVPARTICMSFYEIQAASDAVEE